MKSLLFLASALQVQAFWRMRCGTIQTGRIDPIISPGQVAGHVHMVSGASNFNTTSTYDSVQQSFCTSCEIQDDKSAYWTPLLYYQRKDGSFIPVRNDGTVVYYLGRGDDRANIIPFPPGFKMVSGDPTVRSYDNTTLTYNNGRPISDRVSFNCLGANYSVNPETPSMVKTNCPNGLRAQIQFQSCWDGVNLYKSDQSHVAYMSQIDNGVCPPTHPKLLPHLFYEIYYWPNEIDTSDGGEFVFSNGDPTGYGFHGDFLNGWNSTVLQAAVNQCMNTDDGNISDCPPLAASDDQYFGQNCPERSPLVNEQVKGVLSTLPGCNVPSYGPGKASTSCNQTKPGLIPPINNDGQKREIPKVNTTRNGMTYQGCFIDNTGGRALTGSSYNDGNMTLENCASYCQGKGYSVFGSEFARECYCGNTIPSSTTNQSDCAMACIGNLTEYCGSGNRLSVWSTNSTSTSISTISLTGTTYLGCYSDSSTRSINAKSTSDQNMTLEMCRTLAQNGNYRYFGLEYARECYAGNTIGSSQIGGGNCNMFCSGNNTETCGGSNALSVFSNNKYVQTANNDVSVLNVTYSYQGCYSEGSSGRSLGGSSSYSFQNSTMTVDQCASTCYSKGFAFAGTEYSTECYCNNVGIVNGGGIATDTDCNMVCGGNQGEWCGGPNRVSVFKMKTGSRVMR